MTANAERHLAAAVNALRGETIAIAAAPLIVPATRGLYAVYASAGGWNDLGIEVSDGPLYVGKAERSLVSRDVRTHFTTGATGNSTLRRSLAALLQGSIPLNAVPRNKVKPSHYSNFAIERGGDELLTEWMVTHLSLAVWPAPESVEALVEVERAVLALMEPPLNLKDVPHPSARLKVERAAMANQARLWASRNVADVLPGLADVVDFISRYFEEGDDDALSRISYRPYGWLVDTQPIGGELLLGPGPLIIDSVSGDYWRTSSSPPDVFGDAESLGWYELKSRALFEQWRIQRGRLDGHIRGAIPADI